MELLNGYRVNMDVLDSMDTGHLCSYSVLVSPLRRPPLVTITHPLLAATIWKNTTNGRSGRHATA